MGEDEGLGDISDTTLEEYPEPEQDWNVEGILAEANIDDEPHYLVYWTGYDLADASWEPGDNLLGQTVDDWRKNADNTDQDANVRDWYKARLERQWAKLKKARSRDARRKARGLEKTNSLAEAELEFMKTDDNARAFGVHVRFNAQGEASEDDPDSPILPPPAPLSARRKPSVARPKSLSQEERSLGNTRAGKPSNRSTRPTGTGYQGTARLATLSTSTTTIRTEHSGSTSTSDLKSPPIASDARSQPWRAKQGPLRAKRSSAATASKAAQAIHAAGNIFISGKTTKPRKGFLEIIEDPRREGKSFPNLRIRNLAFKRGREKADRAPATLPKLFPISEGPKSIQHQAAPQSPLLVDPPLDVTTTEATRGRGERVKKTRKSVRFNDEPVISPSEPKPSWTAEGLVGEPMDVDEVESLFVPLDPSASIAPDDIKVELSASTSRLTPARKVSLQDYQQNQQSCLAIKKNAVVGPSTGRKVDIMVDGIKRLPTSTLGYSNFLDAKLLSFTHLCAGKDLQFHLESIVGEIIGSGFITSSESSHLLEHISERLKLGSLGAVCFGEAYGMVAFPVGMEEWGEVDDKLGTTPKLAPSGAGVLRHIVFTKGSDARYVPGTDLMQLPVAWNPRQSRKLVFEKLLGFDYTSLLPTKVLSGKDSLRHGFYLAFPDSREELLKSMCLWLFDCNPTNLIAISRDEGSWEWFVKATNSGTIVIHELALPVIRRFTKFYDMANCADGRVNFWCLSESLRPYPLVPSTAVKDGRTIPPARINMYRLLPTGFVVLLTPSFLLTQPAKALEFLEWFKERSLWVTRHKKVAVFHDVEDWLSDVDDQKSRERKSARAERNPSTPGVLARRGLSKGDFEARRKLWGVLYDLVVMSRGDVKDEESVPLVFCPDDIDANDEQSQVNWFIHFANSNLDRYRQFMVLGTEEADTDNEQRCTLLVNIPEYVPGTVADPDVHARKMDGWIAEENRQRENSGIITPPRSTILANEHATEFVNVLSPLAKTFNGMGILYERPVGFYNLEMADYYDNNYTTQYETYKEWFSFLFPFTRKNPRNTYIGFFYTVEEDWDPNKPKPKPKPHEHLPHRHPWVAFYRPVDPHKFRANKGAPQREYELLIWDCTAAKRFPDGSRPTEDRLIDAQRKLIGFLVENTGEKNPNSEIVKVWLGGFEGTVSGTPSPHPLDMTLSFVRNAINDTKTNVPAAGVHLEQRGFREVKPARKGGKLMHVDAHGDNNGVKKKIFHPPRGNLVVRQSRCENNLFKRSVEAKKNKVGSPFPFRFPSTQHWYMMQKLEGRGAEHILIGPAQRVFEQLSMPGYQKHGKDESSSRHSSP